MATFPDQLTDYLQESIDKFTFTINEALDNSETEITISGGTAAFTIPCIINIEDELIKCEGKSGVDAVSINTAGTGYSASDVLTISSGNGDCTVTVNTVDTGGEVLTVTITTEGSGYSLGTDEETTVSPTGGSGCTLDITSLNTTDLTSCTRGFGGTSAASHSTGTAGYIPFSAEGYEEMVNGADAVRKYLCRTVASLPSSGEEYEMVEYGNEIYIYNGASWERIGITTSHDDWKNLDVGDPHPVYYTESELEDAHDALGGGHVIDGDTHDHLDGVGFGALDTTTSRISSPPTVDGEIVLNTTTGVLYISYIDSAPATTDDWIEVTGAPSGLVMAFDPANLSGSCPSGWSRYTALDEKFVKGTTSSPQTTGGSQTHSHDFDTTDVVTHSHSINSQSMNATASETHTHTGPLGSLGGTYGPWKKYSGGGGVTSNLGGAHSHTATMSNDTESTGEASPQTDSANGEPPYQKVIWCQKD